ncbi:microtubule associated protein [Crepidotus variabilis]|uniref:Microtubule associated protein n=1 Tax=Crepidotus variabilis TaxID=179855 RepID=A0A9P6EDP9_9AGAR|nr:microtubule associated protein [Crepidotus variabilis]
MTSPSTATALTSLLNSLHTHLQSQTQLLPTLHAQLGLPQLALEDDLRILQKELLASVEAQVERRRKEVDEWMARCDEIEKQCVRYTKALGGNIKATGSSIGELRKEQALPRRFELISEYQEKLRQVYHTKLEQLNSLTNRLNVLARTLGFEYFAFDILESTYSGGENSTDPTACRDVTPERFLKLEKELVRGKAEVHKRLAQLSSIFIQIDWLYTELGISPPELDDVEIPTPPFKSSTSIPHHVSNSTSIASSSSDPFLASTPTPASRSGAATHLFKDDIMAAPEFEYQQILTRFIIKLEEVDPEGLPDQPIPFGLENIEPTPGLLAWASDVQNSLEDTKRRREAHIQMMYDQLEGLWRRMGVADEDMDAFVENHKGSTEATVQLYEDELERMLELKRERMGAFVESAREEIVKLWDELMIGEDERADFAPFADDEFTEELLTIHEDEIKRLKQEKRVKAPLLAAIKKYLDVCDEQKELSAAASDQSRLTGRGPRDPGRLLREEKMRKRVQKEKPRLEQELLTSIPAWEDDAGRQFLVHGEPFLQMLFEKMSEGDEKENKRKQPTTARAGSVPARATTPTQGYVPGTKVSGSVTPAVRTASQVGGAGSNSVPNKRQRLGDSSTSNAFAPRPQTSSRVPLGGHRGMNGARPASPTKLPAKTPTSLGHLSSRSTSNTTLPRPAALGMVMPKPGTQHHALGHGRVPTAVIYGAGVTGSRSVSSVSAYTAGSRVASAKVQPQAATGKRTSRAKKESFRPRPSIDHESMDSTGTKRWGCGRLTVKEEEYA